MPYFGAVDRKAPLAARPARQLSTADFAIKQAYNELSQGKAFYFRKTAPTLNPCRVFCLVPKVGLEPTRYRYQRILRLLRYVEEG